MKISDSIKIGGSLLVVVGLCFWADLKWLAWTLVGFGATLGIAEAISYACTDHSISQQVWASKNKWKVAIALASLLGLFIFLYGHLQWRW